MGTNYYFRNKEEQIIKSNFDKKVDSVIKEALGILRKVVIVDRHLNEIESKIREHTYYDCEMIHIGRASFGWSTIFQAYDQFSTVKQMREFYESNKHRYEIVNEYDRVLTWEELETDLINRPKGSSHIGSGVYKDEEGYWWANYEFN